MGDISRFLFGDGTHAAVELNLFGYDAHDNTGLRFRDLGDAHVAILLTNEIPRQSIQGRQAMSRQTSNVKADRQL